MTANTPQVMPGRCRACEGTTGRTRLFAEKMYGTAKQFEYFECSNCATLSLLDPPEHFSDHYPVTYYSFSSGRVGVRNAMLRWLKNCRARVYLGRFSAIGRLVSIVAPVALSDPLSWIRRLSIPTDAKILDVGCGAGDFLHQLAACGYTSLTGCDPFLASDNHVGTVALLKRHLTEVDGSFDAIFFNHSLEHIADPGAALRAALDRLSANGICIVRLPTVSSFAYETYGENWVQLDAPRHVTLFSTCGFDLLSQRVGFTKLSLAFDSTEFQFWGSELYRAGITLVSGGRSTFTRAQIRIWRESAIALNESERGDQFGIVLSGPRRVVDDPRS